MAAVFVVNGAFLSSVLQEFHGRLTALRDFRNYFEEEAVKKFEITLSSINDVLDDAETKQYKDPKVKNWLDDLRHEVYELEKLLDLIDTNALQRKGTIRYFVSGIRKGSEYWIMIKELLRRLEFLAEQKYMLGLQKEATRDNLSTTTSLVDESSIYGREHEKEEIIHFLLSDTDCDNQISIINIVGLGGMGKTALAQLAYNDHRIMEHFEIKAWVYVSQSNDLLSLTQSILRSFQSFQSSVAYSEDLDILQRQLQQRLTGKRYLLVLDDVWSKDGNMWEHLLLPFNRGTSGSKIIVTTRDRGVASVMGSRWQENSRKVWGVTFSSENIREYLEKKK
ncbi:CC-NBS-LRR resistance protein [Trifolium pratense]|uniref:CC-NBS-LRR resistance protein n=1 Tax=Trifolium pratense TaxID=57577 RepID=A0A2K3M2M5_TRIPR|nr:CC-NBS-LRR resistance protein [Trifolium pratense]